MKKLKIQLLFNNQMNITYKIIDLSIKDLLFHLVNQPRINNSHLSSLNYHYKVLNS